MRKIRFIYKGSTIGVVDEVIPKLNLLAHAQMIELDVGSRCGGHGICGGDRLMISLNEQKQFLNGPTGHERELLTTSEIGRGVRLACQAFPSTNEFSQEIAIEVLSFRS